MKYFGVYLDEHLNDSAYAEIIIPKPRRANGMLANIRHFTSPQQTKSIYHAIFGSHMTYAPNFRDHIKPTYLEHNLLKIKDLISLKNCLLIHYYFNHKLPSSFDVFS